MSTPSRLPSIRRPGNSNNGTKSRPMSMIESSLGFSLGAGSSSSSQSTLNKPTTKTSKRRSLLPQFSTSRKASAEEQAGIPEGDELPVDAYEYEQVESSIVPAEVREPILSAQSLRPLPRPARPMTMFAGSTTSASSKLPGARTSSLAHGRTLSTASLNPQSTREGALAALSGAPTIGARSSSRVDPQSSKQSAGGLHMRQQSLLHQTHSRANSTASVSSIGRRHAKTSSVSSLRPPSSSQTSPPRTLTYKSQMPPPSRPNFNSFQQHYSPAKSTLPKPQTSSTRTGRSQSIPSEETADGLSSEQCLHAQVELLQLSLTYQAAMQSMREFDASAKQRLGRKHAKLRKDYESVHALEREQQRITNLAALDAWIPDTDRLVDTLHLLDLVRLQVDELTGPDGRYTNLVDEFETWLDEAEKMTTDSSARFAEHLPETWHTLHKTLTSEVKEIRQDFDLVPRPQRGAVEKAGIGQLLTACRQTLEDMSRELKVMSDLELSVLEREKNRLDEEIRALELADKEVDPEKPWVPAWQTTRVQ